jgi:CP family cyanate transporter-like MFS transporter
LRTQLAVIGPLLPSIQVDLAISHAAAGLLTALPVLCMGLAAFGTARLVGRLGAGPAVAASLTLAGLAGIARAVVPDIWSILAATLLIGIGIGVCGASVPVVVKRWFAARPAGATGIHVTAIILGAVVVASTAVPLAEALGSWRWPLAATSVATLLGAGLWLVLAGAHLPTGSTASGRQALPYRSRAAWFIVALFCLQSLVFWGLATWLPAAYVERGWTEAAAAGLVAVLILAGLPASFGVGWLADRIGSRRGYWLASSTVALVCCIGFIALPDLGLLWAAVVGLPLGALFALALTLPIDAAARPAEVGPLTGLMLGVGYLVTAVAPVAMGAARDVLGSFTASLGLLVVAATLLVGLSSLVSGSRLRDHRLAGTPGGTATAADGRTAALTGSSEPE